MREIPHREMCDMKFAPVDVCGCEQAFYEKRLDILERDNALLLNVVLNIRRWWLQTESELDHDWFVEYAKLEKVLSIVEIEL